MYSSAKTTKRVRTVIVELEDLEKEYLLVLARLKLVQHGKNESVAVGRFCRYMGSIDTFFFL